MAPVKLNSPKRLWNVLRCCSPNWHTATNIRIRCASKRTSSTCASQVGPPIKMKSLPDIHGDEAKSYDPQQTERGWYEWWEAQKLFKPQFTATGKIKPEGVFSIPSPPPNITGSLHIGHALTIALQDSLVRFNRMKGKTVLFLPGFDHAGIATQSVVERKLWKTEKKTRNDYGRDVFVDKIMDWKDDYHKTIKTQIKKMGGSYDWSRESFTLDTVRSKAVTEAFVKLHDEGLIYRDTKLVNWSTCLRTAISNLEVENIEIKGKTFLIVPGYDEPVEFGTLTLIGYPVIDSPDGENLVVSTTRPETIFGDTAIAVHPEDPRYKHLHGKYVQHPLLDRILPIVLDKDIVDMEFGTGAVKITPAHDLNDYRVGKKHGLEFVNIFSDDGLLNKNTGPGWEGMKRFEARVKVTQELMKRNFIKGQVEHAMSVPICSRSGDVIEPLLKPQWWVSQKEMALQSIRVVKNGDIKIRPEHSEAEYFRWLENVEDWCISRQLWWGHRCPAYFVRIADEDPQRSDGRYWVAATSFEEAEKKAQQFFPNKSFTLEQDEDVLDTWFSSGLWALSTLGWPRLTPDLKTFYPYTLLETGWDILFFWVARMILLSVKLIGTVPFQEVFCHPLVRDANGRKMSKSLGNVIDPLDVVNGVSLKELQEKIQCGNVPLKEIERALKDQKKMYPQGIPSCGTDALRFALCSYTTNNNRNDINLDIKRVENYRKFINKFYQATRFLLLNLGDTFQPPKSISSLRPSTVIEKWMLHTLSLSARSVSNSFEERDFAAVTQLIYQLWYQICDNFIEYFKFVIQKGTQSDIDSGKKMLYVAIDTALKLTHPMMPFVTEELWQRLPKTTPAVGSVLAQKFPVFPGNITDPGVSKIVEMLWATISESRSLCNQYGIMKNAEIEITINKDDVFEVLTSNASFLEYILKNNVKTITLTTQEPKAKDDWVFSSINTTIKVGLKIKGHINEVEDKIVRLEKRIKKLENRLRPLQLVANSQDYLVKVGSEIRNTNKQRMEELQVQISTFSDMVSNFKKIL
ncbi:valine--tRNA ligase KNAG_0B01110 [Huiozyma naganishii CBS 8797]|uniref:valine--tRNA ligase n=1 Tax=Huiozyma naganishii (strain ATCC MYA-139 / BCRC 22969 / CBS 8797 / KCTC 17520 / NBRC 10181 / NCYC 3082 / Yp74L-3) TaxID=1071383 RepID=J7RG95_HUIN7|nr:hypothetical protein KNAG_0B01110 [Kazachstania naganishii CBS 8797]CCK68558.1 hypothetical protein KNAG_0B01110 [Kazachstania naganishii CBS 8797]